MSLPRRPASFAELTGQARRLRIAQAGIILGGLIIVAGWWQMKGPLGVWLTLLGTALSCLAFAAECLSVRCPKCRAAVVWHTFRTRRVSEADAAATYQTVCPKCAFDPSLPDGVARE